MVFHRYVIAVIGALSVSTSAAAGPVKLSDAGPSLDVSELRASGGLGKDEIRALFFRGVSSRNPAGSCGDCLSADGALSARNRGNKLGHYKDQFPFDAATLYKGSVAAAPSFQPVTARPNLLTGVSTETAAPVAAAVAGPLSNNAAVSPQALAAVAAVPEPGTVALVASGLVGAWLLRRRQRQPRV